MMTRRRRHTYLGVIGYATLGAVVSGCFNLGALFALHVGLAIAGISLLLAGISGCNRQKDQALDEVEKINRWMESGGVTTVPFKSVDRLNKLLTSFAQSGYTRVLEELNVAELKDSASQLAQNSLRTEWERLVKEKRSLSQPLLSTMRQVVDQWIVSSNFSKFVRQAENQYQDWLLQDELRREEELLESLQKRSLHVESRIQELKMKIKEGGGEKC